MPWSDIEKRRQAIRNHYYANKTTYITKAKRRRLEIRQWLNKLKESRPCTDCGQSYPYYVMDFDHVKEKCSDINQLMNKGSYRRIEDELNKCELVCSNCHRIRTHDRLV